MSRVHTYLKLHWSGNSTYVFMEKYLRMLGHFVCFFVVCGFFFVCFFKLIFSKKIFQEFHHSVKQFGSRSGLDPDLDPNCLQRLSADNKSRQ